MPQRVFRLLHLGEKVVRVIASKNNGNKKPSEPAMVVI